MKSIKMFGKSVPLLTIVMVSVLVVGASAGLLAYYGRLTSIVSVAQSVVLDGASWENPISESFGSFAGNIVHGGTHNILNRADDPVKVTITSELTGYPTAGAEGLTEKYPEYRLNALVEDDAIFIELTEPQAWSTFTGISFDYFIEEDGGTDPGWTPQINIRLMDGDEPVYGVSWHSFRTDVRVEIGERASMTYVRDDFYIYNINFDVTPSSCLYKDASDDLKTEMDSLTFSSFTQQAGDTSVDPNDPSMQQTYGDYWPSKSQQDVWVANHATQMAVAGIKLRSSINPVDGQAAEIALFEFRMVYKFHEAAIPGTYTVETAIEPLFP